MSEYLSLFLFSIYINDLVLFYADDIVIMVESADELQHALSEFLIYCSFWKLRVNVEIQNPCIFKGFYVKNKVLLQ